MFYNHNRIRVAVRFQCGEALDPRRSKATNFISTPDGTADSIFPVQARTNLEDKRLAGSFARLNFET
jgi:hypothetical protein